MESHLNANNIAIMVAVVPTLSLRSSNCVRDVTRNGQYHSRRRCIGATIGTDGNRCRSKRGVRAIQDDEVGILVWEHGYPVCGGDDALCVHAESGSGSAD